MAHVNMWKVWICNGGTHWLMVWISLMYAMQAAFSPSMWTFGVTIDCWIETPGVAGTGGRWRDEEGNKEKQR